MNLPTSTIPHVKQGIDVAEDPLWTMKGKGKTRSATSSAPYGHHSKIAATGGNTGNMFVRETQRHDSVKQSQIKLEPDVKFENKDHLEPGTSTFQSPAESVNDETFVHEGIKAEAQNLEDSDHGDVDSDFYQESCSVRYTNGQMVCDIKFEPVDHDDDDTSSPEASSMQSSEECSGAGWVKMESQKSANNSEFEFGIKPKHEAGQKPNFKKNRLTSKQPMVCTHCGKEFTDSWKLKRHLPTHSERAHKCTECDAKFTQASVLQRHMLKHTGEKPFRCTLCDFKFPDIGQLKRHMVTHTGIKCTHCQVKLASASSLRSHMQTHSGDRPYQCSQCDAKFVKSHHLKRHLQVHMAPADRPLPKTVSGPHVCSVCGAHFTHGSSLRTHMRSHTGERPYSCTECDRQFSRSNSLKKHMMRHTGQRPYQCDQCGSTFIQSSHLKVHMVSHTGDRPHQCNICDKRFGTTSTLHSHMRTHSGGKK